MSCLLDQPVRVWVLREMKLDNKKIWTQDSSDSSHTEATIWHLKSDIYKLELKHRGTTKPLLEINFRKIKSYIMRARCWHEVSYEGHKVALRFNEDKNFDVFYHVLETVLKVHQKFTKPKNDKKFLEEVKMFKLEKLKPLVNDEQSPMGTSGTVESSDRKRNDPNKGKTKTPIIKKASRPLPLTPTPSRLSANALCLSQNASDRAGSMSDWSNTSDEEPAESTSSAETPNYIAGSFYCSRDNDAFQSSAGSENDFEEPATNEEEPPEDLPPPVPHKPRLTPPRGKVFSSSDKTFDRLAREKDPQERLRSNVTSKSQNFQSPCNSSAATRQHLPVQLPKKPKPPTLKKPPKQQPSTEFQDSDSSRNSGGNRKETHGSCVERPSSSPKSLYGTASPWTCEKCTVINVLSDIFCFVCKWKRPDAWRCQDCFTVYSVDVGLCSSCFVWRCRLCTFQNNGQQNDMTLCKACHQS